MIALALAVKLAGMLGKILSQKLFKTGHQDVRGLAMRTVLSAMI
jgi:hypothetical protein